VARFREVVKEDAFEEAIRRLAETYPRIEDVVTALEWDLARDPDPVHHAIPGTSDHILRTPPHPPNIPSLRVLYSYDDEKVHLKNAMEASVRISD